ncbi:MAG: BREX-3 system P-loop-containing protein BrxF [Chloroflexi bacterium]|nr:BREX-3 system P-loop-containing protein BrxF [Chloroflexota bacterium]
MHGLNGARPGKDVIGEVGAVSHSGTQEVVRAMEEVAELYHRLVLVVGPTGSGKTAVLHAVARQTGFPCIDVGAELSRLLLELSPRQRVVQATRLLDMMMGARVAEVVLVDNIEILFDQALHLDPLRCLERLSRHRTVIAACDGHVESGYLTYAVPGHPEHRRCPANELRVVTLARGG